MLFLYVIQKIAFVKVAYFSNICYHASLWDPKLSVAINSRKVKELGWLQKLQRKREREKHE
jgi:hypothetical protein